MIRRFAAGAPRPAVRSFVRAAVSALLITLASSAAAEPGRSARVSDACLSPGLKPRCSIEDTAAAPTLSGRVTDPSGRPVAGAEVVLLKNRTVVATTTSGPDGSYGPIDLPAGIYGVTVVAAGLRLPPTVVTLGTAATPLTRDLPLVLAAREEAVIVSAAQVDTTISRSAGGVSVISQQDVSDRQARSLTDVLTAVPGFAAASSGTTGAQTSVFPRGGESDYTLVLIDGVPQNAFGGAFDGAHLALANVERVEVVRGPQSALYGSGAIGGLVHVVTRSGGPPQASVSVEGGGYGTGATVAQASASRGAWSFGGGFDWLSTEGDTRTFESIEGPVTNDDYQRLVASGSVGWSDRPGRRVRIDVRGGRNERGFPGPYGSDPLGLYGGLDTVSRGVNHHASIAASALLRSGGLTHRLHTTLSQAWSDFTSPFGPSEDSTDRVSGRYQVDTRVSAFGVSAGAEWIGERAQSTFITDALFGQVPVERSNLGLFLEARPDLHRRLIMTVGLRAERIDRQGLVGDGSRPDFDSSVVWSANPKVAVSWIANEPRDTDRLGTTTLRGSAGTGIKAPTAFDIAFTDNPDLKPERNRSVDVGVEQQLWRARVLIDAAWFRNSYDDLIVTVTQPLTGVSRYKTDNIANARSSGLELGAAVRVTEALSARAAWTWLDTEIQSVDTLSDTGFAYYDVGDALVRRPRQSGSLELRWSTDRATGIFLFHQRGSMRDLEPNWVSEVVTNPGRAIATLGGSIRLARGLDLYGRITNFFDREYEDVYGFPAMGRSVVVGLRAAAGH